MFLCVINFICYFSVLGEDTSNLLYLDFGDNDNGKLPSPELRMKLFNGRAST